jgi:hypothetical protein
MGPPSYMRSVVDRNVVKRRTTLMSSENCNADSMQCNRGVSSETLKTIKMRLAVCSSRGHRPAALHCTQHSLCKPCEDACLWWWDSVASRCLIPSSHLQGHTHRHLYCVTLQMMIRKTCLQFNWECLLLELPFVCQVSDFVSVFLKWTCIAPHGQSKTVRIHPPHLDISLIGKSVSTYVVTNNVAGFGAICDVT